MRNLKKVLALVVAFAMVMSMGAFSAFAATPTNATEFKDWDDIQKLGASAAQAADFVVQNKFFIGGTDEKLDPAGTFTFEQYAIVTARILYGQSTINTVAKTTDVLASELKATKGYEFTDVAELPAESRAAIYLLAIGDVIVGSSDKAERLVNPKNAVTPAQVLKMLLGIIGVDTSKFVGTGWDILTLDAAKKAGFDVAAYEQKDGSISRIGAVIAVLQAAQNAEKGSDLANKLANTKWADKVATMVFGSGIAYVADVTSSTTVSGSSAYSISFSANLISFDGVDGTKNTPYSVKLTDKYGKDSFTYTPSYADLKGKIVHVTKTDKGYFLETNGSANWTKADDGKSILADRYYKVVKYLDLTVEYRTNIAGSGTTAVVTAGTIRATIPSADSYDFKAYEAETDAKGNKLNDAYVAGAPVNASTVKGFVSEIITYNGVEYAKIQTASGVQTIRTTNPGSKTAYIIPTVAFGDYVYLKQVQNKYDAGADDYNNVYIDNGSYWNYPGTTDITFADGYVLTGVNGAPQATPSSLTAFKFKASSANFTRDGIVWPQISGSTITYGKVPFAAGVEVYVSNKNTWNNDFSGSQPNLTNTDSTYKVESTWSTLYSRIDSGNFNEKVITAYIKGGNIVAILSFDD